MAEKSLNQVARQWREQYEKGHAAYQRQNYDYAIAILTQVLQQEPAFWDCRQTLRAAQFKKAGTQTGFFKKVLSGASSSPLIAKGQLALRSNPVEAIQIAEQILTSDPHSTPGHKLMADAALAADLPKTAILSLEILFKNSPKDDDIGRELAQAYAAAGQVEKAEAIYNDLIAAHPHDAKLSEEAKNLAARKTLAEGGYEKLAAGGGSYRDVLRDKEQAVALEQEHRQVKTEDVASRLLVEKERQLQAEPDNMKLARSIADLYVQKKEYDRALEYLNYIAKKTGVIEPGLENAIIETTLRKFDHALAQLDPAAPDHAEKSGQIKGERDNFLLEQKKKQVEKYPNDLQLRFELGQAFFKANKISEAIQEFQKAQNNPNKRVAAMSYLGQCFAKRGMNDMAARKLQDAVKEKLVFDEEKKELVYALGCVLEKMGKAEEAIEQFKQIYEVDIGFKDVSAKVDAYYAGQ